jgi:hypothetical protein
MVGLSRSVFFIGLMTLSQWAGAAVVARVDRNSISENETVLLSIEASGNDDSEPETEPLTRNFEVLSRNHSSSYSYLNGVASHKSVWEISLRPRHAGTLTIPAIRAGSSITSPIVIEVKKIAARSSPAGKPSGDIWIDMEAQPTQLLVQQQMILTIRIYQGVSLNQAQMSDPKAPHAIIERLGKDKTYQAVENGRTWLVTERRYALFPQQSGQLEISPVQLDASVLAGGNMSFFQSARPVRARSNSLSIEVKGIPKTWNHGEWLPAKEIQLIEQWPDKATGFKVGEAITRTLTIQATGLSSSQLPIFSKLLPDNLKAYPDQPVLDDVRQFDGLRSQRQEKIAIMPTRPGTYILPEISIPWWNTSTGKVEVAHIAPRTFKVAAAATSGSTPPVVSPADDAAVSAPASEPVTMSKVETSPGWKWLAIATTTGWLLTLAWLWKHMKSGGEGRVEAAEEQKKGLRAAKKQIEQACRQNQAKACEQALLRYAKIRWPDRRVNNLAAMAQLCGEPLKTELSGLEHCLYASTDQSWSGAQLPQALQSSDAAALQQARDKQVVKLPDLYPT